MLRRITPVVAIIMVAACALADGPPFPIPASDYMPVSQIKPGMTGTGKTVYKGTQPSTFQFQVIGVLPDFNYGTPLIVVRISGGPMTERKANVAGGMSGSPMYIDGKLIGACSRMLVMFGTEPLCGVTPIENMFESFDPKLPQEPGDFALGPTDFREPVEIAGRRYRRAWVGSGAPPADLAPDTLYLTQPPPTLLVSGLGPRARALLQQALPEVTVTPGGRSASDDPEAAFAIDRAAAASLVPGSVIGISYAVGDVEIGATGTLTYVKDNYVLIFGHPSLGIGPIEGVLRSGHVLDYMPSLMRSEKLCVPDKTVGMSLQDRPWSVSGVLGKMPDLVPVNVHVVDHATGRTLDLAARVAYHPMYTDAFVISVLSEAMDRARPAPQDTTAKVRFHVTAEESIDITRENCYFSPLGASDALDEISSVIGTLTNNQFHPVRPTSVEMEVDLSSERTDVEIERIVVDKAEVDPGDEITVTVYLKPHRQEAFTKTMHITVPKDATRGKADLTVGTSGSRGLGGMLSGLIVMSGLGDSSAETVADLLDEINREPKNTDLVATLALKAATPAARGRQLKGLPRPLVSAMVSRRATGIDYERQEVEVRIPTEYVVTGSERISLTVQGPRAGPGAPTPPEMPDEGDVRGVPVQADFGIVSSPAGAGSVVRTAATLGQTVLGAQEPGQEEEGAEGPEEVEPPTPPTPPQESGQGPKEKPVGRQPTVWSDNTADAFRKGEMQGVGTSSEDDLRLVPALKMAAEFDDPYVFCVVPDGYGSVFLGTGNHGRIYRVADGKSQVLFTTPEIAVLSMAIDRDGNIIAGTAPNGKVFSVTKDGRGQLLFDAEEPNVTAVCVALDGAIYAGVSEPAKVYQIAPDGKARVVFAPEAMCVTTLAPGADGSVLVGLGQPGCVYRIDGGDVSPVYDSGADYITAVAETGGAVYTACDPGAKIDKVKGKAVAAVVKKAKGTVRAMATDTQGNVYAIADDVIMRIDPEDLVAELDSPEDADLSCLGTAPNGEIAAGTFAPAQLIAGKLVGQLSGTFESDVHEAGVGAKWGRVTWLDEVPEGADVRVYVRSGDVSEPDATWSAWSGPYASGDGIAGTPRRYAQYKIEMTGDAERAPIVKEVDVSYLTRNRRPTISVTAPKPGEHIGGEYRVQWKASDPDKDKLEFTLYCSADGGKTWQKLSDKVETKKPDQDGNGKPEGKTAPKDATQIIPEPPAMGSEEIDALLADMESQMRQMGVPDSEISSAMAEARSAMEAGPPRIAEPDVRAEAEGPGAPKNAGLQTTSFTWKTADIADGEYLLKAVASDRIANGSDAEEENAVIGPVTVCNKKPTIALPMSGIAVGKDGVVSVSGSVLQALVDVTGVEWRVDEGQWRAAGAEDGIFDSDTENYSFTTDPLGKGKHKIEVRAFNSAGLTSTESRDVTVE
jgi:hypothetical protein